MLKPAALSSRPQPSRSPQPLQTGFIRFFSPSSVPRSSSFWRPGSRLQCIPIFPLSFSSRLQYFLLPQVPSAFQAPFPQPASLLTLPSLRSLLPTLSRSGLHLPVRGPSLCSSSPICFSSALPRPITSFLYLSPDSPGLSSRPLPRFFPSLESPGEDALDH